MKIAIMATGGVGGYFGARLTAAGEDVHSIARGQHLAALRANGLVLKSANGDLHLQSVSATDDPASIGKVDIVIFAVKQYDTESAAKLMKPAIGADTAAITLQNGMDKDERLRALLGHGHVMDGAAYIGGARIASPGVIDSRGKGTTWRQRRDAGRTTRRKSRHASGYWRSPPTCSIARAFAQSASRRSSTRRAWRKSASTAASNPRTI
jgi:2-dehydropantoate 2-reductase